MEETKSLYPKTDRNLDDLIIESRDVDGNIVKKCFTDADPNSRIEYLKRCSKEDMKCMINHFLSIYTEIYDNLPDNENKVLFIDMLSNFMMVNAEFFNITRHRHPIPENENGK